MFVFHSNAYSNIFLSCHSGVLSNNMYLIINSAVLNTRVHTNHTPNIFLCFKFPVFLLLYFASPSRRITIIHPSPSWAQLQDSESSEVFSSTLLYYCTDCTFDCVYDCMYVNPCVKGKIISSFMLLWTCMEPMNIF